MALEVRIVVGKITSSETSEACFSGISQNFAIRKWHIGPVELDTGVQGCDRNHIVHAGGIESKVGRVLFVIVRLDMIYQQ